jgi:hypothetical protein
MDAATLYIVLTLPNGEQRTSTVDFSTLWKCEAKAEWFELIEKRKSPDAAVTVRCEEHKTSPAFYANVYDRRGHPRDHVEPLSRQGCTAYKWVIHMRDRGLTAHCYELDRSSNNDEPKIVPDGLDMRGQPGVPGAQ